MLLEKPAFPVSADSKKAGQEVGSLLEKRQWLSAPLPSFSLEYVPYWFFNFDVFHGTAEKHSSHSKNSSSLNAVSREFDAGVAELLHSGEKPSDFQPLNGEHGLKVFPSRLSAKEALELIRSKLALQEKVSKDNVVVSGLELFFVPFWIVVAPLGAGKSVELKVNAASGKILNPEAVPEREKEFSEAFSEALSDLSAPEKWAENIAAGFSSVPVLVKDLWAFFSREEDARIIMLGIIAAVIILWAIYVA